MLLEQIRTIIILTLTVFGCTGNILTLFILNRSFFRKMPSATLISGLCIADFFVLVLHSLKVLGKMYFPVTSFDCVVFFSTDVFRLLSVWFICFINLERCSLVFNPCRVPRLTSRTKSRAIVAMLFIVSLMIFSHYTKHTHTQYVYQHNETNATYSYCAFKPNFQRVLWECVQSAVTYWFTIPVCIVCNIIIVKCLCQASRFERSLNSDLTSSLLSNKQRVLTAMLVASSMWFVVTSTPSTIHSIYLSIVQKFDRTQYIIHTVTKTLLHFHHASNFLVFFFTCARFRIELVDLFRHILCTPFYKRWYKRSIPTTEQFYMYSTRQPKAPVKLFTQKPHSVRRNNQHGMALLVTNNYQNQLGRNYGHCRIVHMK